MSVDNLEKAFKEMWDFITDLPSGLDGFESDFDAAFRELKMIRELVTAKGYMLIDGDIYSYSVVSGDKDA